MVTGRVTSCVYFGVGVLSCEALSLLEKLAGVLGELVAFEAV